MYIHVSPLEIVGWMDGSHLRKHYNFGLAFIITKPVLLSLSLLKDERESKKMCTCCCFFTALLLVLLMWNSCFSDVHDDDDIMAMRNSLDATSCREIHENLVIFPLFHHPTPNPLLTYREKSH